jgi:predicted dehydrogenase
MALRWGILAAANIANKVSDAIHRAHNATLVAVASRDITKAESFAKKNNIPKWYGSYEELLADKDIDVVYIPLPTILRAQWAIKAAKAGKHILVDKPAAVSAEELREIGKACKENDVHYMDATMWVHARRTKEIEEKYLKDPEFKITRVNNALSFSNMHIHPQDIRFQPTLEPTGAVGDLAWYNVGNILWAYQWKELPTSVIALGRFSDVTGSITALEGILIFANGRRGTFNCSFHDATRQMTEIVTEKNVLTIPDVWFPYNNEPFVFPRETYNNKAEYSVKESGKEAQTFTVDDEKNVVLMIERFSDECNGKWSTSESWFLKSELIMRVLDAVHESIKNDGKKVQVK